METQQWVNTGTTIQYKEETKIRISLATETQKFNLWRYYIVHLLNSNNTLTGMYNHCQSVKITTMCNI